MNLYGNYSFLDLGFNDPTFIESLSLSRTSSIVDDEELQPARISSLLDKASKSLRSPPKHRHDGTSPLPLGMDWSPPPRVWDGHDTIWPHDSQTGWSYCATIPSWTVLSRPRGSAAVVLYRVQIGIQSPDGFTTTREILRRFSDFLKLLSERRCLLEDWMTKVLSDIELSRSAHIGIFLELEAAARSSFYELNQNVADVNSSISVVPSIQFSNSSDVSLLAGQSSFASDCGNDSAYGTPELGSPTEGMSRFRELDNAAFYQGFTPSVEAISEVVHSDSKPAKDSEQGNQVNRSKMPYTGDSSDVSTKRIIDNAQVVCKDEMELFSGRENLTAFGHDKQTPETDISSERISDISNFLKLEALRNTSYDSAEGSELLEGLNAPASSDLQFPGRLKVVIQLEEQTKMNRILSAMQLRLATAKNDMEDLLMRLNQEHAVRQYLATKVKDLEIELESLKQSGKENLQQAIQMEREKFTHMLWDMEELRRKCVEMELNLTSEQRILKEERQIRERANAANIKLLHECEIVRNRLEECSVSFLIEEENKLVLEASSPSDAIDILSTSDNRIGLLLAEAQLLAEDVETTVASRNLDGGYSRTAVDEMRKQLADVYVDNAKLRKQMNSVIRYALQTANRLKDNEEESAPTKTALTKFLEG